MTWKISTPEMSMTEILMKNIVAKKLFKEWDKNQHRHHKLLVLIIWQATDANLEGRGRGWISSFGAPPGVWKALQETQLLGRLKCWRQQFVISQVFIDLLLCTSTLLGTKESNMEFLPRASYSLYAENIYYSEIIV